MLPPPICSFSTRDELISYCKNFAIQQGYILSISNSAKDRFLYLICDLSGAYRNRYNLTEEDRKRKTGSRKIGCQFSLYCFFRNEQWNFTVKNGEHTHMATDLKGHPSFRRLNQEEIDEVNSLELSSIPPRSILSHLRLKNPETSIIQRTLYNHKAKVRRQLLAGRTPIQALMDDLNQSNWFNRSSVDSENKLSRLFFANPISISLVRRFNYVLLLDCTYKTNRFGMPLLNIIGITSCFTSFFCGFAFLKSELEEDYIWALTCLKAIFLDIKYPSVFSTDRELALMNAIVKVFPGSQNLLCIWHIEKNILAKCKNKFETTEKFKEFLTHWNAVIYSDSESSYYNNLLELYSKWGEEHVAIRYIRDTWLIHKEKFVAFWADKHFHINSKVTSRVEGQNGVLKRYLNISTGDVSSVRQKLELAIVN
jgi:hypothetical protein